MSVSIANTRDSGQSLLATKLTWTLSKSTLMVKSHTKVTPVSTHFSSENMAVTSSLDGANAFMQLKRLTEV